MGFNTRQVKEVKNLNKNITPGNIKAEVTSVKLQADTLNKDGLFIMLGMETAPVGGSFVGFNKDNSDPSKGTHLGQVGVVKSNFFAYRDGTIGTTPIKRDEEMQRFFSRLATELGVKDQIDQIEADTVEEWVKLAEPIFCNGKYLNVLVGGKEYLSRKGYPRYELFIAKAPKGFVSFESAEDPDQVSKVGKYDQNNRDHFKPGKVPVTNESWEPKDETDQGNNDDINI